MSTTEAIAPDLAAVKQRQQRMWASGDFHAVAALIRRMLPTGGLDLDLVADHLAHHRRTRQRQLAAQGTTFGALVDQVRREEAERYLRDTDMPLAQLAGILGLSEHSALTRACRRWFGVPPSQLRRARDVADGTRELDR